MAHEPKHPIGRTDITGTILSTKVYNNERGYLEKMLIWVEDCAGYKVWTSIPKHLWGKMAKGDRVRMRVTLKPSKNDPAFAIGVRPYIPKKV